MPISSATARGRRKNDRLGRGTLWGLGAGAAKPRSRASRWQSAPFPTPSTRQPQAALRTAPSQAPSSTRPGRSPALRQRVRLEPSNPAPPRSSPPGSCCPPRVATKAGGEQPISLCSQKGRVFVAEANPGSRGELEGLSTCGKPVKQKRTVHDDRRGFTLHLDEEGDPTGSRFVAMEDDQ